MHVLYFITFRFDHQHNGTQIRYHNSMCVCILSGLGVGIKVVNLILLGMHTHITYLYMCVGGPRCANFRNVSVFRTHLKVLTQGSSVIKIFYHVIA